MRVILASKSPRRREILASLGVKFEILSADADESSDITAPKELVRELALRKGRAVREMLAARGEWDANSLFVALNPLVLSLIVTPQHKCIRPFRNLIPNLLIADV